MNFVYENIEVGAYEKVKTILCSNLGNPQIEKIDHCNEALKLINSDSSMSGVNPNFGTLS